MWNSNKIAFFLHHYLHNTPTLDVDAFGKPSLHPMALLPVVKPCPPIMSASKLFYSVWSASSHNIGEGWQHLLLHVPPI
jgi:hypothetical protein